MGTYFYNVDSFSIFSGAKACSISLDENPIWYNIQIFDMFCQGDMGVGGVVILGELFSTFKIRLLSMD